MIGRAMPRFLCAQVLGAFRIEVDGRPLDAEDWLHGSAERLARLLLITPAHRLRREAAAELLWPEANPQRAAANLRRAIHFLRRALDGSHTPSTLEVAHREIGFAQDLDLSVDLDALLDAAHRISNVLGRDSAADDALDDELEVVVQLGARELLPDDPEEWTIRLREQLLVRWERGAILLAERALAGGRPARAVEIGERILERDPASEEAHRLLIRTFLLEGLPHAARLQMAMCRRALREAYDVEPGPETVAALGGTGSAPVDGLARVPAPVG